MTENSTTQPAADANTQTFPAEGKLMALDVGLARIGIALCDPLRLTARPHSTLTRASRNEDFARLAQMTKKEAVQGVVCGLPLNMDGSAGPQAQTTRKWAMRLAQALRALLGRPVPIALWDERLSSFSAQDLARQWPRFDNDALAATVILESFLAAQKRGEPILESIVLPPRSVQNEEQSTE
jgi:putative Holliday junction resolvase